MKNYIITALSFVIILLSYFLYEKIQQLNDCDIQAKIMAESLTDYDFE